ncbi:MAG TPA: NF041680 family putative transposase [Acidimicrobiales bacterium]|nr:NF041680 family putative transposase [Acidimicrobiales bacterium]
MGDHRQVAQLLSFRDCLYASLTCWADALFELCDAALCAPSPVSSIPALSLEPTFRRSHGSLYKALQKGGIDEDLLRRALVSHRPRSWPLIFAVDTSTFDRCDAECSPERGFYYSASKHSAGQPIVAGWSYQWIAQLSFSCDSWTAPMDVERIAPTIDASKATIEQIGRLVRALPKDNDVPLFVFDAGYDPIAIGHGLASTRAQVLCRIRDDRVFYGDPPPRPNRPPESGGRPPRHGKRFKCSDETTWSFPDDELVAHDLRYGTVRVQAWHDMHPRLIGRGRWSTDQVPPIVKGAVIRVEVEHLPKPVGRVKKTLWLFWSGTGEPDLDRCWRAYLRRFDIEHTFRFAKHTLGWTTPSLCTPEQADRWTWLVVGALTQLRLARALVDDLRLPWERPRAPSALTPTRVRRGFRRLRATIGTPANAPKRSRAGPGRPKGTRRPPRTRYPVIKKTG